MWGYHDKNVVLNKGEIFHHRMEHMAWSCQEYLIFFRDHSMGPTLQGGSSNAKSYDFFSLSALGGLVI